MLGPGNGGVCVFQVMVVRVCVPDNGGACVNSSPMIRTARDSRYIH